MAQRGTGTYLLVREGMASRASSPPPEEGERLLPDTLPGPPAGMRIRRRAVALQPQTLDSRLVVWLDPGHEATDRLYRAATPLIEALGPVVLVSGVDAASPVDVFATNLAGACCAYHATALVDLGDAPGRVLERLGLPEEGTLTDALAARGLDPTAPIEVVGPARGLDVLAAPAPIPTELRPGEAQGDRLRGVVRDLAARSALVLIVGPSLAELGRTAAWQQLADGLLVVGPPEAAQSPDFTALAAGPWPVGWLAVDCPPGPSGAG